MLNATWCPLSRDAATTQPFERRIHGPGELSKKKTAGLAIDAPAVLSKHANTRAQQRGVPPLIVQWLLRYGEETYDGHGATLRIFSRASVRTLERAVGAAPVRRLAEFMHCYLVVSTTDGTVITVGKRYSGKRLRRR